MISAARRPPARGRYGVPAGTVRTGFFYCKAIKKASAAWTSRPRGESACFRGTTLIRRRLAAGASPGVRLDTDRLSL